MEKGAILIRDVQGHKSWLQGLVMRLIGREGEPVNVCRGELVVPQPERQKDGAPPDGGGDKKLYPYSLLQDPTVTMLCSAQDVAPMDATEFSLLAGIKSREDRYEVFLSEDDHLEWGTRLKRGDYVLATLPSSNPHSQTRATAVIRYVGQLPQEAGIQFGVEIVEKEYRGQGATDGTFLGKALFHFEDNCGLFLGLDKIHPISKAVAQGPPQGHPGSAHSDSSVEQPLAVKKGDRVVVHNKKGEACHGTVQWIGRDTALRVFQCLVAGLVMDSKVSNSNFERSIPGMSHLVSGPKSHALFLPMSLVSVAKGKGGKVQGKSGGEVVQGQGDVEQTATTALAKEMNISREELIKQQQQLLKETNENKDIASIKAVDPEFDVERQRQAIRQYEIEKKKPQPATQSPPQLPPRGTGSAGREGRFQRVCVNPPGQSSAGTAEGPRMRRQVSSTYEPVPGHREEEQRGSQHLPALLKEAKEIASIKAVDPEFDVERQREAYRAFEKEKKMKSQPASQTPPLPPRAAGPQREHVIPPDESSAGAVGGPRMRRQVSNTYEPVPGLREKDQSGSQHLTAPNRAPNGTSAGVAKVHHGLGLAHADVSQPRPQPAVHSPAIRSDRPPTFPPPTSTDSYHGDQQHLPRGRPGAPPSAGLDVGSAVQLAQDPSRTGVIRWTGYIPEIQYLIAGVELDEPMDGCGDGEWRGHQYFSCLPGRGYFCLMVNLRPDIRVMSYFRQDAHVEQEQRSEAKQVRDQLAAQSLEQQRLSQQVEQLLEEQTQQTQQNEQLQREKQQLEQLHKEQQQQIEQLQNEIKQYICQLEQLQGEQQQKERENQYHIQQLEQWRMQEIDHLQQQLQQEQEKSRQLQERLDTSAAELERIRPATQLLSSVQFNTINRTEIQIQTNIGKGAWGEVARGKFKGQPVAVKWPHLELLQPNMIDRMQREVRIMAQVRHPNLVRFIAAVLDEAAEQLQAPPMIITELLDTNLRLAYEQGRLQTTDCVTILRDVAYALHYLHEHLQPIIHRDISAPNILLQALPNRGWLAKVSDFGSANLAKLARTAGEGAIIYTAPEAFPHNPLTKPPPLTTKVDVYSYGILTCEVITSQLPVPNKLYDMLQQVKGKWQFMYNLIVRCTKRSPQDRPTMAQVLDELNTLPRPPPRPLPRPHQ